MKSFILLLLSTLVAPSATYYVRTDGNNSNTGLIDSAGGAWLTVQKAADTMVAGDNVIVKDGSFIEQVFTKATGTAGSPITFTGSGASVAGAFVINHQFNYLDNFNFTTSAVNPLLYGSVAFTQSNIRITRNRFYDNPKASIIMRVADGGATVPALLWPTNVYIAENIFSNIANVYPTESVTVVINVGLNYSTLESNYMVSCAADAIDLFGSYNTVRRNTITNMLRDTLWPLGPGVENHIDFLQTWRALTNYHSLSNLVEQNIVINSFLQTANLEIGFGLDQFTNDFGGWLFRNNIFVNTMSGMNIGIPFCHFQNNTFYRSADGSNEVHSHAVVFFNQDGFRGWGGTLTNNIMVACGYSNLANGLTVGFYAGAAGAIPVANYNYVAGLVQHNYPAIAAFSEANGVNGGNPMFVSSSDMRLQAGSPAIDIGANLSTLFPADFADVTRTVPWDSGAYEFVATPGNGLPARGFNGKMTFGGKAELR